MTVLIAGETKIDSETDIRAGEIGISGVNDAFDLYLVKLKNGNYRLIVFMKIQFFFEDADNLKWTYAEKVIFVKNWKLAIKRKWSGRVIKSLKNNKKVFVDFRFNTQIDGWMLDHWEITVKKVVKFTVSSINPLSGNVNMDSLDLKLIRKKGGKFQRGAVHEFGHMLGLSDEYFKSSKFSKDYKSVMNSGEKVYSRHDMPYMKWLNTKLVEHKVK